MEIVFLNKISSDCRNTFCKRKYVCFSSGGRNTIVFHVTYVLCSCCVYINKISIFSSKIGNFPKENYIVSVFGNMSKNLVILKFI